MPKEDTGATTGASPSPSQPSTTTPSATTKKIDFGMGPQTSHSTPATQASGAGDMDDDTFFKVHGDRIFKHPRVKEVLDYQRKYKELEPLARVAEGFGGSEGLQEFSQLLGPVYQYLVQQGDQASTAWGKLVPILQGFLNGEDIMSAVAAEGNSQQQADEDVDPRYSALTEENKKLMQELSTVKADVGSIKSESTQKKYVDNVNRYDSLLSAKAKELGLPENIRKRLAGVIITNLPRFMPRDNQGRALNPLDNFNEAAFNKCWEEEVLATLKDYDGYYKGKITKKVEEDGDLPPDTHAAGQTPGRPKANLVSRDEKTQRLAQFIKRGVAG